MDFDINNDKFIEILVKKNGKKTNTYISNWDIDETTLKHHLKILKKQNGCGGSITTINSENGEDIQVLHLQGERSEMMVSYLLDIGINKDVIRVKN